jgi:hypothetical protein
MTRRFNYRRVKIHRNYPIAELAALIGAHKQTIGRWIAAGLPTTDRERPYLIRGLDFHEFIRARRPVKQKCPPGEFYCVRCREPKRPACEMADYIPRTATRGSLTGICPTCGTMIYRAITLAKLDEVRGDLEVAYPKAQQRLNDSSNPLLNVASNKG